MQAHGVYQITMGAVYQTKKSAPRQTHNPADLIKYLWLLANYMIDTETEINNICWNTEIDFNNYYRNSLTQINF